MNFGVRAARDRLRDSRWPSARALRRVHAVATVVWVLMVPLSVVTGWLWSVAFVAACSIYANAVGHASAWQASRAEQEAQAQ